MKPSKTLYVSVLVIGSLWSLFALANEQMNNALDNQGKATNDYFRAVRDSKKPLSKTEKKALWNKMVHPSYEDQKKAQQGAAKRALSENGVKVKGATEAETQKSRKAERTAQKNEASVKDQKNRQRQEMTERSRKTKDRVKREATPLKQENITIDGKDIPKEIEYGKPNPRAT